MKNFFSSPPKSPDLQSFSKLEIMQKQLRELRDDNQVILENLRICVKGIALLVSAPEPDDMTDIPELEDK